MKADRTLPAPGTLHGPCAEECAHTVCHEIRRWAEDECYLCGDPIGYDRTFYRVGGPGDTPTRWAHATCFEQAVADGQED